MSEKFCFINQKQFFKILRGSEENAVLFCHEDILKGIAIKLYSCGNPPVSLEFCGEVSCSAGIWCRFHNWPFTSSGGNCRREMPNSCLFVGIH